MRLKTTSVEIDPKALSADFVLELIDQVLAKNPGEGKKLWDCMAAVRGPDIGLDTPNRPLADGGGFPESDRVSRKKLTTSIIRGRLFPGAVNCSSADISVDEKAVVKLPPKAEWDHFDKHIFKVCQHRKIPYQIGDDVVLNAPPVPKGKPVASWKQKEAGLTVPVFFPGLSDPKTQHLTNGQIFSVVSPGFDNTIVVNRIAGGAGKNFAIKLASVDVETIKNHTFKLVDFSSNGQGVFVEVETADQGQTMIPVNKWHLEQLVSADMISAVPVSMTKWSVLVNEAKSGFNSQLHLDENNNCILLEQKNASSPHTIYYPDWAPLQLVACAAKVK